MKQHNDPLVTRGSHYFYPVRTSQSCPRLAGRMEPVDSIVGRRTAALYLGCCWEWNHKPGQQVSPETIPGTLGCVLALSIGCNKSSGNKAHKQIDPGPSSNFQQRRSLGRAGTNSGKVLWLIYQNPTPTLDHLSAGGPVRRVFINTAIGAVSSFSRARALSSSSAGSFVSI